MIYWAMLFQYDVSISLYVDQCDIEYQKVFEFGNIISDVTSYNKLLSSCAIDNINHISFEFDVDCSKVTAHSVDGGLGAFELRMWKLSVLGFQNSKHELMDGSQMPYVNELVKFFKLKKFFCFDVVERSLFHRNHILFAIKNKKK